LNDSWSTRRRRTIVGAAVLALALGGLATAVPAQASAGSSAASAGGGAGAASGSSTPDIGGGSPPVAHWTPVISDSLNPGGVTAPDPIVTCNTSEIAIDISSGGVGLLTYGLSIPVGCLTLYNGEWVKVAWTGLTVSLQLTQQTDGNLVLTSPNGTTTSTLWSSKTTFAGNANGPGCLAQFQSNADLVVDNCDGTLIWDSKTHTYPDAVLVFQQNSEAVIYASPGGTALWTS
jgi:hypothetical protein